MRSHHRGASDDRGPATDAIPQRGLGLADMRAANRALIIATLEREGPLSRAALARRVGLSRATVGSIIHDLLHEGIVREDGSIAPAAVGRPATRLRLTTHPRPQ